MGRFAFAVVALFAGAVSGRADVSGIYDVRAFGAKGDGVAKDTLAIQRAVDAAAAAGGGEVRLPAGRYLTGSIFLRGNIDFNVTQGAVVEASRDPSDYNAKDVCPQNSWSKTENTSGGHLFLALMQTNVTLRGFGRIEGSGVHFMTNGFDRSRMMQKDAHGLGVKVPQAAIRWRPSQLVYFVESANVRLIDVTVSDAPYWSVFLHGCENVTVRGVRIRTSRKPVYTMNGDGLNLDCCRNVRVSDCDIETSDDALCLRASGAKLLHAPAVTENVVVENCLLSSWADAIRIGVGDGVVRRCVFANLVIRDTNRGINFSSTWFPSKGVDFEDIRFDNVVSHTDMSFLRLHRLKATDTTVRNIHFSNISGTQREPSYVWSRKGKPFENITFTNVDMDRGVECVNVDGLRFSGGTFEEIRLSPDELKARNEDIETFRRLLY